jgi:hypothetical protein
VGVELNKKGGVSRGIEGYRGVLAEGYAPIPLIPMGIASRRKDAHTTNTHGHLMSKGTRAPRFERQARPDGPVLRCSMVRVLTVSIEIVSVLTRCVLTISSKIVSVLIIGGWMMSVRRIDAPARALA